MGKGGTAPKAPDPRATANAQTASNQQTAITQAGLNMTDQVTPYGNLTYSQNGKWQDGTPRFTATTTLSPAQQQLLDTGNETQQNLAKVGAEQSGRIGDLLNAPMDWSAQQGYLNDLTAQNLDPVWSRNRESLETQLLDQGIRRGSEAYTRASDDFERSRSSSYNDANLNNFTSALQSQLALRAQPLNEIIGLASGSQVQSPVFGSTPQTGVAGTDVAGITQNAYQNQMGAYQNQQQQSNQMLGGLFSAGANLLPFVLSDRNAKENIKKVGETNDGQNLYSYNYKGDNKPQIGLMAQEVQKKRPDAVVKMGSLLAVDYGKALEAA